MAEGVSVLILIVSLWPDNNSECKYLSPPSQSVLYSHRTLVCEPYNWKFNCQHFFIMKLHREGASLDAGTELVICIDWLVLSSELRYPDAIFGPYLAQVVDRVTVWPAISPLGEGI